MEPLTAFFVWTFIIGLIGFMILNHNKFQRRDRVLERKIKFQNRNKKQSKPWIEFPHPLVMLLGVIWVHLSSDSILFCFLYFWFE